MTYNIDHYRSYLLAQQISEDFILAYSGGILEESRAAGGVERLHKLATHLGFQLVPVEQPAEQPNIIQIGDRVPEQAIGASA